MKKSTCFFTAFMAIGILNAQTSHNTNAVPINGAGNSGYGINAIISNPAGGGIENSALGEGALEFLNGGNCNTAVGYRAARNTAAFPTPADSNTAVGWLSLYTNTTGRNNVAIGAEALYNNNGIGNTAVGQKALFNNTSAANNTAIGKWSMYFNTTGQACTAGGALSLANNQTGFSNTAFGSEALFENVSGSNNTAVGLAALLESLGDDNTAVGADALHYQTTAINNVGVGRDAGRNVTTGGDNTIVGAFAFDANTVGTANTAVGKDALGAATTSSFNTAVGQRALLVNTTGSVNTAVGQNALVANTTGSANTALGQNAGITNATGTQNTYLGVRADATANNLSNCTALGFAAVVNANNMIKVGNNAVTLVQGPTGVGFTTSDVRFKTNIRADEVVGVEFIKRLKPVVYNLDTKKLTEFETRNLPESVKKQHLALDFEPSTAIRQSGFLAQEVEQAAKESGYNFHGLRVPENENEAYSIAYAAFVVPLVKAAQEQQQMIEELQAAVESLSNQLADAKIASIFTEQTSGSVKLENKPNPFSNETEVLYDLGDYTGRADLVFYDLSGKQVGKYLLPEHSGVIRTASGKFAPGIYVYSLVQDGKILATKRMVVNE